MAVYGLVQQVQSNRCVLKFLDNFQFALMLKPAHYHYSPERKFLCCKHGRPKYVIPGNTIQAVVREPDWCLRPASFQSRTRRNCPSAFMGLSLRTCNRAWTEHWNTTELSLVHHTRGFDDGRSHWHTRPLTHLWQLVLRSKDGSTSSWLCSIRFNAAPIHCKTTLWLSCPFRDGSM